MGLVGQRVFSFTPCCNLGAGYNCLEFVLACFAGGRSPAGHTAGRGHGALCLASCQEERGFLSARAMSSSVEPALQCASVKKIKIKKSNLSSSSLPPCPNHVMSLSLPSPCTLFCSSNISVNRRVKVPKYTHSQNGCKAHFSISSS